MGKLDDIIIFDEKGYTKMNNDQQVSLDILAEICMELKWGFDDAAQLNEEKLSTDFDVWFNKQQITDADRIQYRTINYLPEMDYTYPNFLSFLDKRKQMLRKKLVEILL